MDAHTLINCLVIPSNGEIFSGGFGVSCCVSFTIQKGQNIPLQLREFLRRHIKVF